MNALDQNFIALLEAERERVTGMLTAIDAALRAYRRETSIEAVSGIVMERKAPAPEPKASEPAGLVDASTLKPITPTQHRALQALQQLIAANERVTVARLCELGGPSARTAIGELQHKGYVRNAGVLGAPIWQIAYLGTPVVQAFRHNAEPKGKGKERPFRRFTETKPLAPEKVGGLAADHPAIVEKRSLFPSTVLDPSESPTILVSGGNSRKLGDRVVKGAWSGFPIFQLSLEERATCPDTCFHFATCYGNGMPQARRHRHGEELVTYLRAELTDLQDEHPNGFVVRLHVLGDFYSVEYVDAWASFLDAFPALHVFGYTAWPRGSEIGAAVKRLTDKRWDRFAMRFSDAVSKPQGTTTIWRVPEADNIPEGLVCPAQTGKTDCCGTCGICWSETARDKTIVFVAHGRSGAKAAAPVIAPAIVVTKLVEEQADQPVPMPKPSSSALTDTSRAALGAYLREKRVHVTVIGKGRFQVAGRFMDHEELVDFANEKRREDGLPEFKVAS